MGGIKVKGIRKLEKALKAGVTMEDVKKVVRFHGSQLQQRMQRNASFTRGYQTGATKRSIGLDLKSDGLAAHVGPTTEYSPYLEYGTRFMAAQPFVRPSFREEQQVFIKNLRRLMR
jgi:HK97 gp10 family phage protein